MQRNEKFLGYIIYIYIYMISTKDLVGQSVGCPLIYISFSRIVLTVEVRFDDLETVRRRYRNGLYEPVTAGDPIASVEGFFELLSYIANSGLQFRSFGAAVSERR